MSKSNLIQNLNPQQIKALKHVKGPLLVLAGAGSGKTKVIAHKFAYILKTKKISPESILTVTFNNKATIDMKERIKSLVNQDVQYSWIGTIHSQCSRILRKEIHKIGYKNDFSIYDEDDRCNLIRHILKEFKIYEALYKGVSSRINFLKTTLVGPEEFLSSGNGFGFDEKLAKVYVRYQDELKRSNALDFNDLVMVAVRLFNEDPKILEKYQNSFPYILIDEFQDLNFAQYQFIKKLSLLHKNICAVADDDQSINRFKRTDVQNILNFEKDFPRAKVVRLERNYRSTQNILDVSNAIISVNYKRKDKKLWTNKGCGEKVNFCWLSSEREEAKHIAKVIKELYLKGSYSYSEIGIFYRVNLQSRAIEDSLREAGLPYNVIGGVGFYKRNEIKNIIAYARLILNHGDNVSFRRIINCPPRGIGAATLSKIEHEAKKKSLCLFKALKLCFRNNVIATSTKDKLNNFVRLIEKVSSLTYKNADEMLKDVVEKTGYLEILDEEKRQNVDELISSAEGQHIQEFIDKVTIMSNPESSVEDEYISLMTLHNAKGLEFPVVFITGLEEGMLPYFKAVGNDAEIAEERRLFYVGMTRAKALLLLTGARRRRLYSRVQEQDVSRFLKNVPRNCCHWIEKVADPKTSKIINGKRKIDAKRIAPLFSSGCRVKHPVWGVGIVRDCYGERDDQKVTVNFPDIGLKRLSLKLANLERI